MNPACPHPPKKKTTTKTQQVMDYSLGSKPAISEQLQINEKENKLAEAQFIIPEAYF